MMKTCSFSGNMDEKPSEMLLPSIKGHMVTIPNDVQQLTIKDSTVFIGNGHSRRSKSSCFRCLIVLSILLAIGIGVMILQPTLYRLVELVSRHPAVNSGYNSLFNRDTPDSSIATTNSATRTVALGSDVFNQNDVDSTAKKLNPTLLFSLSNPSTGLSDFFQFTSVYIAHDYRTTLSFFTQNEAGYSTYLDDVSVNTTYGSPLLVNGDFENSTTGWQGVYSISRCYHSSYLYPGSNCHKSNSILGSTLSQTFSTTPGNAIYIGFKLKWEGSGSGNAIKVTIYP